VSLGGGKVSLAKGRSAPPRSTDVQTHGDQPAPSGLQTERPVAPSVQVQSLTLCGQQPELELSGASACQPLSRNSGLEVEQAASSVEMESNVEQSSRQESFTNS